MTRARTSTAKRLPRRAPRSPSSTATAAARWSRARRRRTGCSRASSPGRHHAGAAERHRRAGHLLGGRRGDRRGARRARAPRRRGVRRPPRRPRRVVRVHARVGRRLHDRRRHARQGRVRLRRLPPAGGTRCSTRPKTTRVRRRGEGDRRAVAVCKLAGRRRRLVSDDEKVSIPGYDGKNFEARGGGRRARRSTQGRASSAASKYERVRMARPNRARRRAPRTCDDAV